MFTYDVKTSVKCRRVKTLIFFIHCTCQYFRYTNNAGVRTISSRTAVERRNLFREIAVPYPKDNEICPGDEKSAADLHGLPNNKRQDRR